MCGCLQPASLRPSPLKIGAFTVLKDSRMAEGAYGSVWKCKSLGGDRLYALKEIVLQNKELEKMYANTCGVIELVLREQGAQGAIRLLQSEIKQAKEYSIGSMLFQFATISLFDEILSKKFTQQQILNILLELSLGLQSIHQNGVVHLDVKPENLVLVNGIYKFCDFGSAIKGQVIFEALSKKEKIQFQQYIESNSTLIYRSPEMIDPANKVIGYASDLWMLGCIAYFMLFRRHPFEGKGKLAIISQDLKYPQESEVSRLISRLLMQDRMERISLRQLICSIKELLAKRHPTLQN